MRMQFRFAGVAGVLAPARSPHSEAKFPSVERGACASAIESPTAIQRLPLLVEHVLIRSDDVNAAAVQVCGCFQFFRSSEVTPQ